MENPIKMDDLGVPPFLETPTKVNIPYIAAPLEFPENPLQGSVAAAPKPIPAFAAQSDLGGPRGSVGWVISPTYLDLPRGA